MQRAAFAVAFLWLIGPAPSRAMAAEDTLSYNRDIRPILSDNCFKCHGPDEAAREGKLRLDVREAALENRGGYFAIDPGNAEESEVVWRINADDEDDLMPPADSGKSLTSEEKDILFRWIDERAAYEPHWAYIPPVRSPLPDVAHGEWVRSPIDRFVLARIEAEDLEPAPDADPLRLLRRVYFDLIGLPPTPAEVDAFLNGEGSLDARYEAVVDHLLASPHYGERMAMEWLDVVRFADTNGYHSDEYRDMHPYRDYVIEAFNANKPFDEFTIEQLAGDLFPDPTIEQQIASGYNRLNQITSEGGAQPKEYLAKYMADRVRNLGSVWMGATLGCAECHDHKFDPFTAGDFYSFGAFFADIEEKGKYEHGKYGYAPFLRLPTPDQERLVEDLKRERDALKAREPETARERAELGESIEALNKKIEAAQKQMASTLITKPVPPREIRVLPRGNWMDHSGDVVEPSTPDFLPPLNAEGDRATRMDLAEWLVSGENPLTARTVVNRMWAQFFGRGLSEVLDDFGRQGKWPTHPELLDWLAVEFEESGWDVQHMVRLIVTSSTYRQSTVASARAAKADPTNRLWTRQTPRRLKAELVRDNALAIAGLLDETVGGPSAKPYQPDGYYADTYAGVGKQVIYEHDTGRMQYRRGLYTFWKRSFLHPSLLAFDAPTREECTAERPVSNTPQQALVLLNDPTYVEAAKAFAARLMREAGPDPADRVRHAYKLALGREPKSSERDVLVRLYEKHLRDYGENPDAASALLDTGLWQPEESWPAGEWAAWTSVARAVLNLHEVITRY